MTHSTQSFQIAAAMFSMSGMPTTANQLFSAYASLAGTMMLVRSMADQLIPHELRSYLYSAISYFFTPLSSHLTLIIDENCGFIRNQVYEAAEIYLRTKVKPSTERLRVTKTPRQKNFTVAIEKGEEIIDSFLGVQLKWTFVCAEPRNEHSSEKRYFELSFNKKFKDKVFDSYLPFILTRSKEIKDEEKVVKLYTRDGGYCDDDGSGGGGGCWGSINLEHPATFETLAMDPEQKKTIIEDLERFVRRKEFYKKVGKAWKRGYLLYGPPGTGKSSLIAAMANYLKFDVYDLELSSIYSNSDLRRILISTSNRSILVIEDIDCNPEAHDRQYREESEPSNSRLTLSGLLNFIDGLWSSCGDERIIVFTTNHKDRLDPALLRPGRMDVHIHMSYCNPRGFRILASNYLGIHGNQGNQGNQQLCKEIEDLMENTEVTPAEVAEELMKSEHPATALGGLLKFLKRKKIEGDECKDDGAEIKRKGAKRIKTDNKKKTVVRNIRRRVVRGGRSRR